MTTRGQSSGDRPRERILRGAALRAVGSPALEPQTAGGAASMRTVVHTSAQHLHPRFECRVHLQVRALLL